MTSSSSSASGLFSRWVLIPVVGIIAAVLSMAAGKTIAAMPGMGFAWPALEFMVLLVTVFAAVHHAEEIAHALGEPFGTLVLTLSVTVIECALILSIMLGSNDNSTLARDTTMSVIMIILNLIIGLCLVIGGLKYGEQGFRVAGARSYLIVLIPFCILTLVLPNFTSTQPGPFYSTSQIVFVSMVTLALYVMFLYVQTVRHKDFFTTEDTDEEDVHDAGGGLGASFVLLVIALTAIVLLSKSFSVTLEKVVAAAQAPKAVVGVVVAMLVLLPESMAAISAARRDRMQTAVNLALGSSLATIGLTIPAVGILSIFLGKPLALGLERSDMVLLLLTLTVSMLTFGGGRTNILPGFVHLMLMAVFAFLVFVP